MPLLRLEPLTLNALELKPLTLNPIGSDDGGGPPVGPLDSYVITGTWFSDGLGTGTGGTNPPFASVQNWQPMRPITTGFNDEMQPHSFLYPNKVDFERVLTGATYSQDVKVRNWGGVADTVTSIDAPVGFTITPEVTLPYVLAPNEEFNCVVEWSPTVDGGILDERINVNFAVANNRSLRVGGIAFNAAPAVVNLTDTGVFQNLDQANTTYVLTENITSVIGVAFFVKADGIDVDLNGFDIEFDGQSTNPHQCAFACVAGFRAGNMGYPGEGGGSSRFFKVKNGSLTQKPGVGSSRSAGVVSWSHGNNGAFKVFDDVTITVNDTDASCYSGLSNDDFDALTIVNCNNISEVIDVTNRSQFYGMMMRLEAYTAGSHISITESSWRDGPMGGVRCLYDDCQVAGNKFDLTGRFANAFASIHYRHNDVWGNDIVKSARGIRMGFATRVWNNRIRFIEDQFTVEFGYLEGYGVQFEEEATGGFDTRDNYLVSNELTGPFSPGGNVAIKSTALVFEDNVAHDNYMEVFRDPTDSQSKPTKIMDSIYGTGQTNPFYSVQLINNDYVTDGILSYGFFNGTKNVFIKGGTLTPGPNPATRNPASNNRFDLWVHYYDISSTDAIPLAPHDNNFAIDLVLNGEFTGEEIRVRDNPQGDASCNLAWSYKLTVLNAGGSPLPGATVNIQDAQSNVIFNGVTDANGVIESNLSQWTYIAPSGTTGTRFDSSAHTVDVTLAGFVPQNFIVNATTFLPDQTINMVAA